HCYGKFLVAYTQNFIGGPLQLACRRGFQAQLRREDYPILALLEDAFAIVKLALRLRESTHAAAVEKTDLADTLGNRMAVGAGITVNRSSHRPGNAGECLQPFQPPGHSKIHELLQDGACFSMNRAVVRAQAVRHKAQHESAETFVGNDEVRAAGNYNELEAARLGHVQ